MEDKMLLFVIDCYYNAVAYCLWKINSTVWKLRIHSNTFAQNHRFLKSYHFSACGKPIELQEKLISC